jgi:YggT family protein
VAVVSYDRAPHALSFVTAAPLLPVSPLGVAHLGLGLLLGAWTLLFLFRIVLTWYPQVDLNRGWMRLIGVPTEPVLAATRRLIQPIGGVDVTPVVWVGLVSLLRELLVGQQGVITQAMLRASAAVG